MLALINVTGNTWPKICSYKSHKLGETLGSPLYEGLAADLREMIISGQLMPGQRLPSEADLGATHRVSRHTVRQALGLLAREGLLISGQGRGWQVRERNPIQWHISRPERNTRTDISPADAWSDDVREQGFTPTERIEVSILEPEPRLAARLQLADREAVVVRRRMRFVDGELFAVAESFFPRALVGDTPIALPGDVLPGTYAVLEEIGHPWVSHTDEIVARNATAVEADRFGIQSGDPVAEVIRTRFGEGGRPIAATITVAPGDRVVIIIEGAQS